MPVGLVRAQSKSPSEIRRGEPFRILRMQQVNTNVKQLVSLLAVASMEASLRFYVEGLGFAMIRKWVVDGKVRWCWLELGDAAVMLQQFSREGHDSFSPRGPEGEGEVLYFI